MYNGVDESTIHKGEIMMKQTLICVLLVLALTGCSKSISSIPPTPTPSAVSGTPQQNPAVILVTPTSMPPLPAVTPTSSASPTPFTPFTVVPAVDNLKLRVNPGYLFEALMMVQQTDKLTVQGMSPGGEWVYVKTEAGDEGWVFGQLLTSSVDVTSLPVREPKGVLAIKGLVSDASGLPIQGVAFDISQGAASEVANNVIRTDASGMFYAFLPDTASGSWTVTYTAIGCVSNVWSDSTCSTYKPGYTGNVDPVSQSVDLGQAVQVLKFTWK
jgi:hypothetical protein